MAGCDLVVRFGYSRAATGTTAYPKRINARTGWERWRLVSNNNPSSWVDFNRSTHSNQFPNLIHLFVRNRNASVGPIVQRMSLSHECELLGKAVQHYVPSGIDA